MGSALETRKRMHIVKYLRTRLLANRRLFSLMEGAKLHSFKDCSSDAFLKRSSRASFCFSRIALRSHIGVFDLGFDDVLMFTL